jgi:hypothetical protein
VIVRFVVALGFLKLQEAPYMDPISGTSCPSLSGLYVTCSCRLYAVEVKDESLPSSRNK